MRFVNASPSRLACRGIRGYDRDVPKTAIGTAWNLREYTDARGNVVDHVILGQEVDVHVKIRATERRASAMSPS